MKQDYSILMTVYKNDDPGYLALAINSMLSQTVKCDEFVIVCDGPLRESLDNVLDDYKKKQPDLFSIHYLPKNVGLGSALQYGVLKCKNRFIARMDSDDLSEPSRCEKELKMFEKNDNLALVGTFAYEFENDLTENLIYKKGPSSYDEIIRYSKKRNPFNHSSVMFKKEPVINVGNYSDMRTNQDVELWVRLINNGYYCLNIPEPLIYFRYNMSTFSKRKNWKNTKLLMKVWRGFWKKRYCSYFDYLYVVFRQMAIFLTPTFVLKRIYKRFR